MRFEEIEPGIRYTFRTNVREYNEPVVHHKLSMAYRFLTIIEGSFRLLTSGIEEECERGDLIYMPPGVEYTTVFHPGNSEFLNIFFDYSRRGGGRVRNEPISDFFVMTDYEKPDPEKRSEIVEFPDLPEFSRVQVIRGMPDAEMRCSEIHEIFDGAERFAGLRADSRLASLLADTAHFLTERRESTALKVVRRVVSYIDRHYQEPLTCKGVALALGYHPNYLNRLMREHMGVSLHDHIVSVKIRAANRMLFGTDMSITDIAYALSFTDSSRFSSVYCAATGMKPSERRRMMQESAPEVQRGADVSLKKGNNDLKGD